MKTPAYTKLYNYILDTYLPKLTEAELKTLLIVARKTVGWGVKRTKITRSYIMIKTGLSAKSASRGIQGLERQKLIRLTDQYGNIYPVEKRKYAYDLHFELSLPPRVKLTHDRVQFPNPIEYNLPIIKETIKEREKRSISKKRRMTDHERILEIIHSENTNTPHSEPPNLPS